MSVKFFWWTLLIALIIMGASHTPLEKLPYYGEVNLSCFVLSWGCVVGLLYGYYCKKRNKKFKKLLAIVIFLFTLAIVWAFGYFFSFGGYLLGFWVGLGSMFTFIFTLLLSIKTLIFVRDGK